MSLVEPGSVARTSMTAPEESGLIASAVLTIGIGHWRPRASRPWAITGGSIGRPFAELGEDHRSVGRGEEEGRHALGAIDQWVQLVRLDPEQVHRQRARLAVHAAKVLGLTEGVRPAR